MAKRLLLPSACMRRARAALLFLVALLLALLLRALRWTWRIRVVGSPPSGACLLAFWHGDLIALLAARPSRNVAVLVSRSRDGQIAARAARCLGLEVVRGSSSSGGVPGALGLLRRLQRGGAAALAVDGPRGPHHEARASMTRLATLARARVVPVVAAARSSFQLSSWDRLWIPVPFTTVVVVWAEMTASEPLQAALTRAGRRARSLAGGRWGAAPAAGIME
jgi:lysophospholipid acyltransferase (LPLAT)-like uncharacterized protein